jgi:hypothetical protein
VSRNVGSKVRGLFSGFSRRSTDHAPTTIQDGNTN